jgi:hypothetical protein
VGGHIDKMSSFLESVVKFVCRGLLGIGCVGEVVVEGEKVLITGNEFIDVIQIYKRMIIFSGLISSENSGECFQLIKQTLKLEVLRYSTCPTLRILVWAELLKYSSEK